MSFVISDELSNINMELNIVGQAVSTADYLLYFTRANKYFNTNYKMPTTQRYQDLLLFNGVNEYPLESDCIGISMPERPYSEISPNFNHTSPKEFIHYLNGNLTAFKFNKESMFLNVNYTAGVKALLHNCDTFDGNGTWSVSGDGSAIATDKQYVAEGEGSIRATVTGSTGQTVFTVSDMGAIDLTDYLVNSESFLDLYNPNDLQVTSVQVRLGSDASNYYQMTATTRFRGDTIMKGFGLIGFDMSTKTTAGTPTDSAIDYMRIVINHSTSASGQFRLDNIFISQATYFRLPYYSKYNVKTSAGGYIEKPTDISDTILCPFEATEAYTYKVMELAAVEKLQDVNLANYAQSQLLGIEQELRRKFPRNEALTGTIRYKRWNTF